MTRGDVRRLDVTRWLIDKSAIARLHVARQPDEWVSRIDRERVHIGAMTVVTA
jgi:hypothetical protein